MAYLGCYAAFQKKFGKNKVSGLSWVFACSTLPAAVYPLLERDWYAGLITGLLATFYLVPIAYDTASEILRDSGVGLTKGAKIVKGVQASVYTAAFIVGLIAGQEDNLEDMTVNIETENPIVKIENNSPSLTFE